MAELDVDLAEMARRVKEVGDSFNFAAKIVRDFGAAPTLRPMIVNLTQARQLLKDSGNNLKAVQVALKAMNVPAKDMALLMGKLGSELGKARKEALGFGAAIGSWSSRQLEAAVRSARALTTEMGKRAGGAAGSALKYGAYGAIGAVAAGAAGGLSLLEKVIETAGFREASIKGLEYNLGRREISARMSAEEAMKQRAINAKAEADATDLFNESLRLAQKTPIANREGIQAVKDFVAQGYNPDQAKFLMRVMADQQSKFLEDPRVKANFVAAFSRGEGRGVAQIRDLESLRIAKFRQVDILANLMNQPGMAEIAASYKGGKYNVSPDELKQTRGEVDDGMSDQELEAVIKLRKLISSNKIAASTLQNAAIAANYAGENLEEAAGQLAEMKATQTVLGAWDNAQDAFEALLMSMNTAQGEGMTSLKNFLNRYTDVLGKSETLRKTIDGVMKSLLGPLDKIFTEERMNAVIKTIGKLGEKLMKFFEEAWKWLEHIIEAEPGALTNAMKDVLVDIGKYLGAGIKTGMWEGIKAVATEPVLSQNAIEQTAAGGIPWRKKAVFPWQREFWGGGSTEETPAPVTAAPGKSFADGGVVPGPMGSPQLIVAHGGERFQGVNNRNPSGGGGGLVIQGPLFVVNGDVKDPDALGAAIKPLVQEEFANVWHRLAMEQG